MAGVVRIPLGDGGSVLVETAADPKGAPDGPAQADRPDQEIRTLPTTLQDALGPVTGIANAALAQMRDAADPEPVEITFGVDLSGEDAVITETPGAGHFQVRLAWGKKGRHAGGGPDGT